MTPAEAWKTLDQSDEICSAQAVEAAVDRLAGEISAKLANEFPLVLSVMGGAAVFTGQLLPRLRFPLEFDYIHVTRYREGTRGGSITWKVGPQDNVAGRTVLVLDDILDAGDTLAEVKARIMAAGAKEFYSAVFADKAIGRAKPVTPDFIGVTLPNRYVFGFGMDVCGAWRNLPAVRALR
jgi:hypoxanthine phosphoribosyltransferase